MKLSPLSCSGRDATLYLNEGNADDIHHCDLRTAPDLEFVESGVRQLLIMRRTVRRQVLDVFFLSNFVLRVVCPITSIWLNLGEA